MKTRKLTLLELQKLNQKLDQLGGKNRYFVYSSNPFKLAFFSFIAGLFHSLGTLFGTVFIAGAIIYIFAQAHIDLVGPTSKLLEDSMSRINWQKIIPSPEVDVSKFKLTP